MFFANIASWVGYGVFAFGIVLALHAWSLKAFPGLHASEGFYSKHVRRGFMTAAIGFFIWLPSQVIMYQNARAVFFESCVETRGVHECTVLWRGQSAALQDR